MGATRGLLLWALCAFVTAVAARAAVGNDRWRPCCTCGDHGLLDAPDREDVEESLIKVHWNPFTDAKEFCDSQTKKVELQGKRLDVLPDCLSPFAVEVNVSYNHLRELPGSSQLNPLLVVLDASSNNISSASDELRTLSALEVLRVERNRLQHLQFLPEPCALRRLHAAGNAIAALDGPLQRCGLLEELDVSDNALSRLSSGNFFGLSSLRELYLARNPLVAIAPRMFMGLPRLRLLDLGFSGLSDLPQGIFDGLPMLEHLILSGNLLTSLPGKLFSDLKLISLDISQNEFTTIPPIIKRITSLEKLDLGGNRIKTVPEKYFRKCKRIRELSLSNNEIVSLFPETFFGSFSLEKLDLSLNPISNLPKGFLVEAVKLEALDLSGCPLEDLSFSEGTKLKLVRLDMKDTKLRVLPPDAFVTLSNLQCLNFDGSPLAALRPTAFTGLTDLRSLFLGSSKGLLKQLPKDIFMDLDALEKLDLHGHQLETISKGLFESNTHLLDLNLEHNKIKSLSEDSFAGLNELQRLMLNNNLLTALPVLRDCCKELSFISLKNNSISSLSKAALSLLLRSDSEREVELRGNPVRPQALRELTRAFEGESGDAGGGGVSLARDQLSCACGSVRRGRAQLRLCVDAPCGSSDVWADGASRHA